MTLTLNRTCIAEVTMSSEQIHDLVPVWYGLHIIYSKVEMEQRSCSIVEYFLMARLFPLLAVLAGTFTFLLLNLNVCLHLFPLNY